MTPARAEQHSPRQGGENELFSPMNAKTREAATQTNSTVGGRNASNTQRRWDEIKQKVGTA